MLWPTAFVTVREQQRESRRLSPFCLSGRDELVDHDLRAVEEVAVLRLPEVKRVGLLRRVSVLESHAGILRERAVSNFERGLRFCNVLKRNPDGAGVWIVKDGVAMAKGTAFGILTREPNRRSAGQQRGECERFGRTPIHDTLFGDRGLPALELAAQFAVERKSGRNRRQRLRPSNECAAFDRREHRAAERVAPRDVPPRD